MMSGTIPIVSGMKDFPFSDEVEWNSFCDSNNKDPEELLKRSPEKYNSMREKAMRVWDKYVYIPSCDKILFDKHINE